MTATLVDGVLTIEGTAGDDWVYVHPVPANQYANQSPNQMGLPGSFNLQYFMVEDMNGGATVYDSNHVKELVVSGGEGNDSLFYDPVFSNQIDVFLRGGPGDDTIAVSDGARNVTAHGGQGNDEFLFADGISDVTLNGGSGNDYIYIGRGTAHAVIDGGDGHDGITVGKLSYDVQVQNDDFDSVPDHSTRDPLPQPMFDALMSAHEKLQQDQINDELGNWQTKKHGNSKKEIPPTSLPKLP